MQIFIGNLPLDVTDAQLLTMFEAFGKVHSASIGLNKKTGAAEGYGIVEMPVKSEARDACEGLRGKEINGGSPLIVRMLKPGDPIHSNNQPGVKAGGGPRSAGGPRGGGAIRSGGGQRGS